MEANNKYEHLIASISIYFVVAVVVVVETMLRFIGIYSLDVNNRPN